MADRLYDRRTWRRLREQQLRREPLCAMHLRRGESVPAQDVHHRVELKQGGEPYSFDNLESLCHSCHSIVTAAEKNGRPIVDVDPKTGYPIGAHWWNE